MNGGKIIKIALYGMYSDYKDSLLPRIINLIGYKIKYTDIYSCDLMVIGPKICQYKYRAYLKILKNFYLYSRAYKPMTLFHTYENIRSNYFNADYTISHDLIVSKDNHYRFPYWMEFIDWSGEGLVGNKNIRFGDLYGIDQLMHPLGDVFLKKRRRAAFFASHIHEPRETFIRNLNGIIDIDGYGPYYNTNHKSHNDSGILKKQVLTSYAFNLCPENSIYPGYYTEKIPDAYSACTLPISWADSNVSIDFNEKSFINLNNFYSENGELATIKWTP